MTGLENKEEINIWIDADMGGDDAWLIVMALGAARLDKRIKLHGLSTVFGNADLNHATRNAQMLLTYLGENNLPVYQGMAQPFDGSAPFGDGAYGDEGFCGVRLLEDESALTVPCQDVKAHDAIANCLKVIDGKLIILSSGPATNLAHLINDYPALVKNKVARMILMSGAVAPGPKPNPEGRVGNITTWAEFNAFQDPASLNVVFGADVPVDVIPMDVAHFMPLNAEQKKRFPKQFVDMTSFVETLDREKFGADGPTVHDPNILIWALYPELFADIRYYNINVAEDAADMSDADNRRGWYKNTRAAASSIKVVCGVEDIAGVFDIWEKLFVEGMKNVK